MTLTDIMPTLRMSIPDPIDLIAWPPQTSATTNDVLVENLSMRGVSELLDTPCEWSTEQASRSGCRTVVMCRVSAVVHDGDHPIVLVDCDVARIGAAWSHARLIGRISVAYKDSFRLLGDGSRSENIMNRGGTSGEPQSSDSVSLPRDLVVGDLLIVPCLATPATQHAAAAPGQYARIPANAARV